MKSEKLSTIKISAQNFALILALFVACSQLTHATKSADLQTTKPSHNNDTHATSGRSMSAAKPVEILINPEPELVSEPATAKKSSAREGRMLDLDRLAGEVGKDRSASAGARQSRKLDENVEERSKNLGKGAKKMAIKGFIPIMSLEAIKDGKHLGSLAEHSSYESDQEQDSDTGEQEQQPSSNNNNQNLREQIASNFGAQTSLGHASFGQPQQQPQYANTDYGQQWQASPDQETARARKLQLTSSLFSSGHRPALRPLSSSLLPSLVQHPSLGDQQQQYQQQMSLAAPMNAPQMISPAQNYLQTQSLGQQTPFGAASEQSPIGEQCICVPFFQCKNGFLSEPQLSKSQLAQISAMQQQQSLQVPRSSSFQDQVPTKTQQSFISQPNGQQLANDIYEQLRQSIESQNLERELLFQQQQQRYQQPSIDERNNARGNSSASFEAEQRSLLDKFTANLSNRRQSSGSKQCGIMRTCCSIPPHILHSSSQQTHSARFIQRPQQHQPRYQMISPHRSQIAHQLAVPQMQQFLPSQDNQNDHYSQPQTSGYSQHQQQLAASSNYEQAMTPPSLHRPSTTMTPQVQPSLAPGQQFMAGRCGLRQTLGISGRVQNAPAQAQGEQSNAEFGEFPAHAAILRKISPGDSLFVCSAVLISGQWLATAAHCVKKLRADELKVRLGEWDVSRDDEFYPHVEANVREIVLHPDFQASSLINDLALIRLDQSVGGPAGEQMSHISPACLAQPSERFAGQHCWLAGWGKDAFGQSGAFQSTLRKVDLPVVSHHDCELALKFQTKLGKYFRLHQNNICAGGERGKDACEGDGGAGLYCLDPTSGLSKAVGLVSWGVGCGQRGVPGVYVNLAQFNQWIEQLISASGEENIYGNYSDLLNGRQQQQTADGFRSIISERSNEKGTNETLTTTSTVAPTTTQLD